VTPAGSWLLSQGVAGQSAFRRYVWHRVAVGIDTALWRRIGWMWRCQAKPSPASQQPAMTSFLTRTLSADLCAKQQ
jgi:hypothetical protein